MPNIKSAEKRVRQSAKRRTINRAVHSKVGSVRHDAFEALAKRDKEAAVKLLSAYASTLDKAAKKGIIKANTANRRKSRLAQRIRALG
ncbi:MAG: 30S ribosomal protein S20 [Kiritimatiellae bacterium]|nr:30S ribosomal protein S20 [Kiritimatiellia bacterium]